MNKWLKRVLAVLASVFVILVLVIVALPLLIDPNSFKGPLQRVAAGQNIHLDLRGPIGWQFYPRLGLSLEDVHIAPLEQPDQPIARAESGTAAVAVRPLLSREVVVDQFVLDGLAINLVVDEDGRGNWEALGQQDETAPGEEAEQTEQGQGDGDLKISVERIALTNASLSYDDRQAGLSTELHDLSVELTDVNLESRSFPLAMSTVLTLSDLESPIRIRFSSQLQANSDLDDFVLDRGELALDIPDRAEASLAAELTGRVRLQEALSYEGRVAINPFNAKALLDALGIDVVTSDPAALTGLAITAQVSGDESQITSEELSLTLDETRVTGRLAATLPEGGVPSVEVALEGNGINVDRYLPPDDAAAEAEESAEADAAEPLPLESLRAINLDFSISIDEIVAMEMPVRNAQVALTGKDGLWELTQLNAEFYEGQLRSEGQLDARAEGEAADIQFAARLDGLSLHPLLMDLAELDDLSGIVTGELRANTQGLSSDDLMENLSAAFVFTSPQLTFQGFNAEYLYCQMATQLDDNDMPDSQWPSRTRITDVEGELVFDESRLTIATLVAYIENLVFTAAGHVDLGEMDYRIRLPMRLAQEQTSPAGCLVESNFLLNREVDIVGCDGSLEEMDLGEQCGIDSGAISDLAQQAVRYNVEKRADEKKEEVREELRDRLRERLGDDDDGGDDGDEKKDRGRDLLRDILRR